jgi:hypothetical protein
MLEPCNPGDFGKNLLKVSKKLKSQNLALIISVGILSFTLLSVLAYTVNNNADDNNAKQM